MKRQLLQAQKQWRSHLQKNPRDEEKWKKIVSLVYGSEKDIAQGFHLLRSLNWTDALSGLLVQNKYGHMDFVNQTSAANLYMLTMRTFEFIQHLPKDHPLYYIVARGGLNHLLMRVVDDKKPAELSSAVQKLIVNKVKKMEKIPAGSFWQGADQSDPQAWNNEHPRHRVNITKPFLLGRYPVTQALYLYVTKSAPKYNQNLTRPVVGVSWVEAISFCNKLSKLEKKEPVYVLPPGFSSDMSDQEKLRFVPNIEYNTTANGYRLPTEAEWEFAARAKTDFPYSGSSEILDVAWTEESDTNHSQPVGQKQPNPWNVYDMSGNVWEWVWDGYGPYPSKGCADPTGDPHSRQRVYRGGCWGSSSRRARVSFRYYYTPDLRIQTLGFRLARNIKQ